MRCVRSEALLRHRESTPPTGEFQGLRTFLLRGRLSGSGDARGVDPDEDRRAERRWIMRRRNTVVVASLAAVLAALVVVRGGASTPPPGSDYAWAQPGCAPVTTPLSQPPAWI